MHHFKTRIDDAAAGQLVIIGRKGKGGNVLMRHTAFGEELDLLDQVKLFQRGKMWVLAVRCMSQPEVERFQRKHRQSWRMGYWFKRTAGIKRAVKAINDEIEKPVRRKRAA